MVNIRGKPQVLLWMRKERTYLGNRPCFSLTTIISSQIRPLKKKRVGFFDGVAKRVHPLLKVSLSTGHPFTPRTRERKGEKCRQYLSGEDPRTGPRRQPLFHKCRREELAPDNRSNGLRTRNYLKKTGGGLVWVQKRLYCKELEKEKEGGARYVWRKKDDRRKGISHNVVIWGGPGKGVLHIPGGQFLSNHCD